MSESASGSFILKKNGEEGEMQIAAYKRSSTVFCEMSAGLLKRGGGVRKYFQKQILAYMEEDLGSHCEKCTKISALTNILNLYLTFAKLQLGVTLYPSALCVFTIVTNPLNYSIAAITEGEQK